MRQNHESTRTRRFWGLRPAVAVAAAALSVGVLGPAMSGAAVTGAAHAHATAHGVEIRAFDGPFGPYIIIGNGPMTGVTVYAITSDNAPKSYGCTTVPFGGFGSPFPGTGPVSNNNAEWPALTTTAAPVAGPGINSAMLHSVFRKGIGHQVTYDGHPLYLFDQGPGQITGEGWDEPSLPPWHGQWWLVNPDGNFQEWSQTLTTSTLADHAVPLSALMLTGAGYHAFPLYSFSADTSSTSACGPACARVFDPLLTTGKPGIEGTSVTGSIGSLTRTGGEQPGTHNRPP